MKRLGQALAIAALAVSSPASAETLTNRSVIALKAAGLDDETIIAKIQSSDTKFDLSTQQLVALKKQGVAGPVLTAMIAAGSKSKGAESSSVGVRSSAAERPASSSVISASRPAGIYLLKAGQMVRIDYNVSGQTKTGGFLGSALSYGIAKISTKVVLQGESARVKTSDPSPTFYFYLPGAQARATASSFEEQSSGPVSPNDFSLLRLEKKEGSREARIGRGNISGYQSGVVSKDRIDFSFDEARPGVFTVRPTNPLTAGEYSFVMIGLGGASVSKFFDFSVQ